MIDFSNNDYACTGQMSFDECLAEIERYKWDSGKYMNLPENEEQEKDKR